MKRFSSVVLITFLMLVLCTSCTKRCRCVKFNLEEVYYTKEEVAAQGKTCSQMQYLDGLHTTYYSYCDWEY